MSVNFNLVDCFGISRLVMTNRSKFAPLSKWFREIYISLLSVIARRFIAEAIQ
ncbi:MAG: hypothetical protein J6M14_02105 [Campylobacter sp.]|nr:hypothetical protein [Campylobacter sp.]